MKKISVKEIYTTRDFGSINNLIKEVRKIPVLTVAEEIDISQKAFSGSKKAKDKLVESNIRFVITIAKQYQMYGIELSDIISEGIVGLIQAADKFNPTKGFRFTTYAVW